MLVLILLLAQPGSGAAQAELLRIALNEDASVRTRLYSLPDVATVHGNPGIAARLAAIQLGRSPRPGNWTNLSRHEIAARLEREIPGISRQLSWSGSGTVRVAAVGVAYPASRIGRFATDALRAALYQRFERIGIELTREPDDVIVPTGQIELTTGSLDDFVAKKRTVVWVDLSVDGEHYQSLPVWFNVTIQADVVTAVRDLGQHVIVDSGDLRTASVDITTVRGTPVMDPGDLIGLRMRRPVVAGDVVVEEIVERPPAIHEGQLISVVVSSGRVLLRGKAIALADGDLDERIAVRNPNSGERYFATVTGPGHVRAN